MKRKKNMACLANVATHGWLLVGADVWRVGCG